MTDSLVADLARFGSLAPVHRLVDLGHSRTGIQRAVALGALLRPCRGWVATAAASQLAVTAVVRGGKLTSATALASLGVWDGMSEFVHVNVPPHRRPTGTPALTPIEQFQAPKYPRRLGIKTSWSIERAPDEEERPWRTSALDALLQAARDLSSEQFIACVDSTLHLRLISLVGLAQLRSLLPRSKRPLLALTDAGAGSGLETLTRLRLSRVVRKLETQFALPGIGRSGNEGAVDFLLDGWLVIEIDGEQWHDRNRDHRRDALLVQMGYRTLHFTFDQVINHWPEVEATILECLRHPPQP